jgi:lysophospholipase L1-like esterase
MARLFAASLAVATSAPVTILPLGDSITFGCGDGCEGTTGCGDQCAVSRPKAQAGYRAPLWRKLSPGSATSSEWDFVGAQQNGPDDIDRDHEGNPGWKIEQVEGIKDHYLPLKPDVILLHLGTNNMGVGLKQHDKALEHMQSLLDTIFAELPNVRLLLSTLIGASTAYGGLQHIPYNEGIRNFTTTYAAAGRHIELVDMAVESAIGENGCNPDYCCPAGIHPTGDGYALMADVWYNHLVGNVKSSDVTVV